MWQGMLGLFPRHKRKGDLRRGTGRPGWRTLGSDLIWGKPPVTAMPIRRLEPTEWSTYFGAFSAGLVQGQRSSTAEIRVFSPELGNQREAAWVRLHGITYEHRSDVLAVTVEGLGHIIYGPTSIWVDENEHGLLRLDVKRADGTEEIVEIR